SGKTTPLVSLLRKQTSCSIAKAREALTQTGGPASTYESALAWLEQDAATSGAKRAAKIGSGTAAEGVVGISAVRDAWAMIEINTETDFVARAAAFRDVVRAVKTAVARWAAAELDEGVMKEVDLDLAMGLEVEGGGNVQEAIEAAIGKLGERIVLRRAVAARAGKEVCYSGYVHADDGVLGMGRVGALVELRHPPVSDAEWSTLEHLSKQFAQQVVGCSPAVVYPHEISAAGLVPEEGESVEDHKGRVALVEQAFLFGSGSVAQQLEEASEAMVGDVHITKFLRFERGEGIEKKEDNFADEVLKQAGLK
ncbi:elongation factor TS-domain-containing protein, partial [Blyttiomyces helicus]